MYNSINYTLNFNIVGIIAFTSFRSRDLMSCDSTSPDQVAEEVYRHYGVDILPNQLTTYQRNKHITILHAVPRVTSGPTLISLYIQIREKFSRVLKAFDGLG